MKKIKTIQNLKTLLSTGFLFIFILCFSSCNEDYSAKPSSYPRVNYPKRNYVEYSQDCPFAFTYPDYATVEKSRERGANPCWINVEYKPFNATLHLSYFDFNDKKQFSKMIEEAHDFAYKHSSRAEDINESIFSYGHHVGGIFYELGGNTASTIQFYATDSTSHYLRGALYFNTHPNRDSIDPMVHFIRKDIDTMLKTLRWK